MTARVHGAEWVAMDHVMDGQGGFLMPDQMMPGAPHGDEVRLGVRITLANPGGGTRGFDLWQEFTLVGGGLAAPRRLSADTLGALARLSPGAAVDGTLYFDLEPPAAGDPPLHLRWHRGRDTVDLTIPVTGEAPDHDH